MHCPRSKIKWVQSQSNEPKNTMDNCQNSIKIIMLLDIYLWCHFNSMLIMLNEMHNLVEFVHLKKFLVIHEKLIQKMRCIEKCDVFLITYRKRFHRKTLFDDKFHSIT